MPCSLLYVSLLFLCWFWQFVHLYESYPAFGMMLLLAISLTWLKRKRKKKKKMACKLIPKSWILIFFVCVFTRLKISEPSFKEHSCTIVSFYCFLKMVRSVILGTWLLNFEKNPPGRPQNKLVKLCFSQFMQILEMK